MIEFLPIDWFVCPVLRDTIGLLLHPVNQSIGWKFRKALEEETLDVPDWEPCRVVAVAVALPNGVTPAGTRGKILEAALALYAELGFYGTSIRRDGHARCAVVRAGPAACR